jgi:hypothetical protein
LQRGEALQDWAMNSQASQPAKEIIIFGNYQSLLLFPKDGCAKESATLA